MTDRTRDHAETSTTMVPLAEAGAHAEKKAYLLVLSGPQFGQIFALPQGRELAIGRKEGVDIHLADDGVSRHHASVLAVGSGARLRDMQSQNGTFVDGVRVTDCQLQDGARVHVGKHTTFRFCFSDDLEAEYQRKLAEGALHEPLTGLYNRRHFMDRLGSELAASQRHQRLLAVLMIDIDNFKRVNDQHGHGAGDEVLRLIAHTIHGALRKEDVLARYGGDEFVVLARETPLVGARSLGDRVRKAVERTRISWQGQALALTVSVGATVAGGQARYEAGRTEREVLEAADRALYQAKESGRNCVVATALPATG